MVLSIVSIFYVTLFQCVCYLNFSMEIPRKRLKLTSLCITLNISGEMLPTYKCCCKSKMFFFRKPLLTLFLNQTLKEWIDSKSHNIWDKKKKTKTEPMYLNFLSRQITQTQRICLTRRQPACLLRVYLSVAHKALLNCTYGIWHLRHYLLVENTTYIE